MSRRAGYPCGRILGAMAGAIVGYERLPPEWTEVVLNCEPDRPAFLHARRATEWVDRMLARAPDEITIRVTR